MSLEELINLKLKNLYVENEKAQDDSSKTEQEKDELEKDGEGDLNKYTSRDFLKEDLEKRGHKLIGSVSKNTDYLVTNTPNSGTVKNRKAKALGKPIITEDQLIEMLGLTPR